VEEDRLKIRLRRSRDRGDLRIHADDAQYCCSKNFFVPESRHGKKGGT
jgi:hypothetical protein